MTGKPGCAVGVCISTQCMMDAQLCEFLSFQAINIILTAIPIIIEVQFQGFQRFSSSKLVLKAAGSRFAALNYFGIGSTKRMYV